MSGARGEVLGRVRAALADVPARAEDEPAPRAYRTADQGDPEERLARFAERVADYRASVRTVAAADLPAAILAACRARGIRRLVVPTDLPAAWRPEGVEVVEDAGLPAAALDRVDGVLSGCRLGIAETGTIVLDGGARQGRRAITLVPDWFLCVVEAGQVVGTVPEAVAALRPAARAGQPLTFVSGPSATSDIELSRVEGVHGPRTLEVLVVTA